MVDVYVTLIVWKVKTIEQVPIQLRSKVLETLNAMGLDGHGDPLPTDPPVVTP